MIKPNPNLNNYGIKEGKMKDFALTILMEVAVSIYLFANDVYHCMKGG